MEKHLERKFAAWCKSKGYLCIKLELSVGRGFPDRCVITPNKVLFLEFKTTEGRLSEHQEYWIEKLGKYKSCKVFVVRSVEEAISVCQD